MVVTGKEADFKRLAEEQLALLDEKAKLYFFMRKMRTSHGKNYTEPLFPGYVFLGVEYFTPKIAESLKTVQYFIHFLNSNQDIVALSERDREYVEHFISFGELQGVSKATFDENDRIVVVEGPLKGFAGKIIRVNRRRCRATVRLDMFNNSITFDLMYDLISSE